MISEVNILPSWKKQQPFFNGSWPNGFCIPLKSLDTDGKTVKRNHYASSHFQHGCVLGFPQFQRNTIPQRLRNIPNRQDSLKILYHQGQECKFPQKRDFPQSMVNRSGKEGHQEAYSISTGVTALSDINGRNFVKQIETKLHKFDLCRMVAWGNPLFKKKRKREHIPSCLKFAQMIAYNFQWSFDFSGSGFILEK